jgi:hypothetical protein
MDSSGLRWTNGRCSEENFQTSVRCVFYFASRGSGGQDRRVRSSVRPGDVWSRLVFASSGLGHRLRFAGWLDFGYWLAAVGESMCLLRRGDGLAGGGMDGSVKRSRMAIGAVTGIAGLALWLGPAVSASAATGPGNPQPSTSCADPSNPVFCPLPPITAGGRLGAVEQELDNLAERFPAIRPVVIEIDNRITAISERSGGGTGRFR